MRSFLKDMFLASLVVLMFFSCLVSVSTNTYYANNSMDSDDIQLLLDNVDITEFHFLSSSGGIFDKNISLRLSKT